MKHSKVFIKATEIKVIIQINRFQFCDYVSMCSYGEKPMLIYMCIALIALLVYEGCVYTGSKSNRKEKQELEQSKTKSTLKTKMGNKSKSQIDKGQWEHMVNRAGSYFPKGGHSATQTELIV